jgi:peptidoglycan/xylan/chitin deacetylase (PgdA/CDA1 family)
MQTTISNNGTGSAAMRAIIDLMKCPVAALDHFETASSGEPGFFRHGKLRLYGRVNGGSVARSCVEPLPEAKTSGNGRLSFDPTEVIDNLRLERYVGAVNSEVSYLSNKQSLPRRIYYALRPLFPVAFRRVLQRRALKDWSKIPFPDWPIDTTVDDLVGNVVKQAVEASSEKKLPFIWYWPRGFNSCAIMTHDVETGVGQDFCPRMLELEKRYGIRSAFELVPEVRYEISDKVVEAIRAAGSEVCIHGLNHDGRLFDNEQEFRRRAKLINEYAAKYDAVGFRSPIMYRNPNWYDAWKFSYDMSLPNAAHLDPQRGGCCTLFPYFIGDVLELPLTTIQDYPLYHVLQSDPMAMWRKQTDAIMARHGLASFIIHPDYNMEPEKQELYCELLAMLRKNADEKRLWLALPKEVDAWWRQRHAMTLVQEGGRWMIRGAGSERASIAWATLRDGELDIQVPQEQVEVVS